MAVKAIPHGSNEAMTGNLLFSWHSEHLLTHAFKSTRFWATRLHHEQDVSSWIPLGTLGVVLLGHKDVQPRG